MLERNLLLDLNHRISLLRRIVSYGGNCLISLFFALPNFLALAEELLISLNSLS